MDFQNKEVIHIVDSVDCLGLVCEAGDIVARLTVDYGALKGVSLEVRVDDRVAGAATGGVALRRSGQRGVRTYDLLKGTYDLILIEGQAQVISDPPVSCLSEACAHTLSPPAVGP